MTASESSADHAGTFAFVSSSAVYSDGSGLAAIQALTPCAYASRTTLASGVIAACERSAARRRPSVRSWTSLPSALEPSSSASVPLACRRVESIWNSRSCACRYPTRKYASWSLFAKTCGTPNVSRSTLTCRSRPATFTVSVLERCASDAPGRTSTAMSARSAILVFVM